MSKSDKYIINDAILHIIYDLITIYNQPCVIDDNKTIQRVDYSNKIYGLLGQLYQEFQHDSIEKIIDDVDIGEEDDACPKEHWLFKN